MAAMLPENPSLEQVSEEARIMAGQTGVTLDDARSAVARRYGFSGWPAVVDYIGVVAELGVDPAGVDETGMAVADRFCALAVLRYTDTDAPPRRAAAEQLLRTAPDLVDDHVWAAAAAADPDALARHLSRGTVADAAGGPFGWAPLLYLCFSRVAATPDREQSLAAATLLLDAGADPNAGYLWRGLSTPFTALTGVFGEGEQGPRRQPRHPHASELAPLLLGRGAHPCDQQALYNRMFRADDSHLDILFAHGLADGEPSPWERRLGEAMETRAQMWQRQVSWAAEHGFVARLELLARHGVDTSAAEVVVPELPDDLNALDEQGATPLHHAAWEGDLALIRSLVEAGADPSVTDSRFDATPQGWAEHAYQSEAAELLASITDPPR